MQYNYDNYKYIIGVDEAGRGALCGPVVAASVILEPSKPIQKLNDSKKLTANLRAQLYDEIIDKALVVSFAYCSATQIDKLNIHHATLQAMRNSISQILLCMQDKITQDTQSKLLKINSGLVDDFEYSSCVVLVDGKFTPKINLDIKAIVSGDAIFASIAASSIIAKVTRDNIMIRLDQKYPQYCLAKHKGYPTRLHVQLLHKHGYIHGLYRQTYKTVSETING